MAEIKVRNVPSDILKLAKAKQVAHIKKCGTCQYSIGKALIDYFRELQRQVKG